MFKFVSVVNRIVQFKLLIFVYFFNHLQIAIVVCGLIAVASAKPGILAPVAYSSPLIAAAPYVAATSSQVVARNYNGLAVAAPLIAQAPLAYSSPLVNAYNPYNPYLGGLSAYSAGLGYGSPYLSPYVL